MGRLITGIDPGIRFTGAVVLEKTSGMFGSVNVLEVLLIQRDFKPLDANIAAQCSKLQVCSSDKVVVEMPRVYPDSPVRVNDIVDLAAMAGALLNTAPGYSKQFTYPREWKGTVKKDVHNKRILKKIPTLAGFLRKYPKGKHEHLIDAAGIALWALGE